MVEVDSGTQDTYDKCLGNVVSSLSFSAKEIRKASTETSMNTVRSGDGYLTHDQVEEAMSDNFKRNRPHPPRPKLRAHVHAFD